MAIYRMEIKLEKAPKLPEPEEDGKRKREPPKPSRTYEYLDVNLLYEVLQSVVRQSISGTVLPLHRGHEVRMLVGLIALTGTDFSRGLPQLSGKSVFEYLPNIWMTMAMVCTLSCVFLFF